MKNTIGTDVLVRSIKHKSNDTKVKDLKTINEIIKAYSEFITKAENGFDIHHFSNNS